MLSHSCADQIDFFTKDLCAWTGARLEWRSFAYTNTIILSKSLSWYRGDTFIHLNWSSHFCWFDHYFFFKLAGGQTVCVKKEPVKMGKVDFGRHKKSSGESWICSFFSILIYRFFIPLFIFYAAFMNMYIWSLLFHRYNTGKEQNKGIKYAPMPFRAVRNINSIVKTESDMQSALVPCVAANPILVEVKCLSYVVCYLSLNILLPPVSPYWIDSSIFVFVCYKNFLTTRLPSLNLNSCSTYSYSLSFSS